MVYDRGEDAWYHAVNWLSDQTGKRATRERVQIKRSALAAIVVMKSRTRDHGGVVRGEARRRSEDLSADFLEPPVHRLHQRRVARDTPAKDDSLPAELACGAKGLLHQCVDQRVLKSARDVLAIDLFSAGTFHRVEHGSLESTERERIVVGV